MADEIDLANDLIDTEISRALSRIRSQSAMAGNGPANCMECDDDMPKERRALGFKYCVPCTAESEKRKSLFVDY